MNTYINQLLTYGQFKGLLNPQDRDYAINRLRHLLQIDSFVYEEIDDETTEDMLPPIQEILDPILDEAIARGLIEDTIDQRDILDTQIMGCITPIPSDVNFRFKLGGTNFFYRFSQDTNYIRRDRIAKDRKWQVATDFGTLDLTINLSKPEKDPRDIERAKLAKTSDYPLCLLCKEHVGNTGTLNQPPRNTHRVVPLRLSGEDWFLQYSPYVYYNEHCIVVNNQHTPMTMDGRTFDLLLDFVEQFPHYFVGSNAGLPIVGGSILSHEHYQGGRYAFAMNHAQVLKTTTIDGVELGVLKWPMTTLRLQGKKIPKLVALADKIYATWKTYNDPAHDIASHTGETRHNTVTPIARFNPETDNYELDMVLRNNRTNAEYPYGIFHAHEPYHHLKKENIGLIEVMGLAVLPGRLVKELEQVEAALLTSDTTKLGAHQPWAQELLAQHATITPQNVSQIVQESIGHKFLEILACCGVYKQTPAGLAGVDKFLAAVQSAK